MSDTKETMMLHGSARTLIEDFSARVDEGRNVEDLFVDDASFVTPRGTTKGAAEIGRLFAARWKQAQDNGRISRHFVSALRAEPTGDDTIEVRSSLLAFALPGGRAPGSMMVADQLDLLRRSASGDLKFARRETRPVMEFDLSPADVQTP